MSRVNLAAMAALPDIDPHDAFELVFANDPGTQMTVLSTRVEIDEFNDEGARDMVVHFIECIDLRARNYVMGRFREETTVDVSHYDHRGNEIRRETLRVKGIKATAQFNGEKKCTEAYRCVYRILP